MKEMKGKTTRSTKESLLKENAEIRTRLAETEKALGALRQANTELIDQAREQKKRLLDSRTAALNLMTDAMEAQHKAETLSLHLALSSEALKRSQDDLNRAQAVAQTGNWRLDFRKNKLIWSDENHRIFGIPKGKDLTYKNFLSTVHPDDREYVDTMWQSAIRGKPYEIEHRLVVDGKIKWVRETAHLEYSAQGKLQSAFGITQDVTAMKEAVEALKLSEERYRSLFNRMSEGFALHEIICDKDANPVDYRFLDINPAFERLTGLKREDLVGKRMLQLLPKEEPYWLQRYGEVALTGKTVSSTHYSPVLGKHYEVFAYQPAPLQFAVLFIDITQRIEMENKLQHLASFPSLNPNPVMELDIGGSVLYANISARSIVEKMGLKDQLQLFIPPDLSDVIKLLADGRKLTVQRDVPVGDRVYAITFTHVKQTNTIRMYSTDVTAKIRARERFKKLNASLEQRVQDRTRRLHAMTLELTLVEQRERKRLADILHDQIQQLLIASKLGLAIAQKLTEKTEVSKAIDRVSGFLDESITASRTLAIELSPPVLYEVGLGAALRWLAGWMKEKHQLDIDVSVDKEIPGDSKGVCILLFQSVRELLFNIVKHAQTKRAKVSIHSSPNGLIRVTVVDEGIGFDSKDFSLNTTDPGLGLFGIRERLMLVGGKFELISSKMQGTTAVLTIPLSKLS